MAVIESLPGADHPVTIDDVLALPILREGAPEVLAGGGQLRRPVRWIHSGEFPDMPSVLKGGELLLSHGMSIPSRPVHQRRYIADLARAGIAGLVIELTKALRAIPNDLLQEARAHDLPLVALHRPIPWIEVTEAIHRAILRRQDLLREHGHDFQEQLVALLATGAGAAEVLHAVSETVGNPVVLSRDGQLLYTASCGLGEAAVACAWDAVTRGLASAPTSVSLPVSVAAGSDWGVASVLGLAGDPVESDRVALARAVPILALALRRAHEAETLAARERGEFLDALLGAEEPISEPEAHRYAAAVGFAARCSWLLALAAGPGAQDGPLGGDRWALVCRYVREELASRGTTAVVGTLRHFAPIGLVVGLRSDQERHRMADAVAEAVGRGVRRAGSEVPAVVCAGRPVATWREVRDELATAVEAVPAMRHATPRAWHDVAVPQLRQLLWSLRNEPGLTEFASRRLAPLILHDERRGTQLMSTLAAYCACHGRKTEAARLLHLERQSLYKRLDRIRALIGGDLEDEDTLLGLHLALRVRQVLPDGPGPVRV